MVSTAINRQMVLVDESGAGVGVVAASGEVVHDVSARGGAQTYLEARLLPQEARAELVSVLIAEVNR